jgi:hypothetical protein
MLRNYSWNSGRLMDKHYHLLLKPKKPNLFQEWGKRAHIDHQFSSASMLPQSSGSSFSFDIRHGVVDMSSVFSSGVSGLSNARGSYSWAKKGARGDADGKLNWLIAPEAAQWLPEGIGTALD